MSAVLEKRRFTVEEFVRIGESGILQPEEHVELIGGDIVVMSADRFAMSPQGPTHSGVTRLLHQKLSGLFPAGRFCISLHSPFQASGTDLPEPDIAVLPGRCQDYIDRFPTKAVLVIEVAVSSHAYDRGLKANLYARAGVNEYWVLDVPGRRVEAFREPSNHGYRLVRFLTEGDEICPAVLGAEAGVTLSVSDLFPPVPKTTAAETQG